MLTFVYLQSSAQDSTRKPMMVQTIGRLPYLEYGLGDDRLGGAKMTYLDSGVVMQVIDSADGDYRVQLSKNHSAYISKENVKPVPEKRPRPYYLTSNWRVFGMILQALTITINLDERLPYRSIQQINHHVLQ